jgi:3-phytase
VRFALFNIWEMSTEKLTELDGSGIGKNEQLVAAAEIIHKIRPDVLVINEIDHDIDALQAGQDITLNVRRFNDAYLNQGEEPLDYRYVYAAPCNTGFLAGKDFDNNGMVATDKDRGSRDHGGDCFGYGAYPGQYSMAILSRFPLETEKTRTFQNFLWKDLPDNLLPNEWYSDDEIDIFRLSSKSHWDIPVRIGKKSIHMLMSHPTPPVFDGPEDRNGRRNYDEIRMWVHYINNDSVMVDDSGIRGGLAENDGFIIAGDLNAAPQGDKLETGQRAIDQLLQHALIRDCGDLLVSEGALNGQEPGPPKYIERRTSGWDGRGLRIDHLLPSKDLEVVDGGVYWPDATIDTQGAATAKKASDHRLIWLDIKVK